MIVFKGGIIGAGEDNFRAKRNARNAANILMKFQAKRIPETNVIF